MYRNRSMLVDNVAYQVLTRSFALADTSRITKVERVLRRAQYLTCLIAQEDSPPCFERSHRAEKRTVKTATNVPHNYPRAHDQILMSQDHRQADFLKGVSHELRTPLNVIIGICQFLERDKKTPLSPMHQDAVERMERNARALLQSVNHLMEYMRNGRDQ